MTLDIRIDFDRQYARELRRGDQAQRAVLSANLARELERGLRRRAGTLWPQDTGFSRDRFRCEDEAISNNILVLNTARYARYVNNRARYASGRRNPNYRAAQRTIEKVWNKVLRSVRGLT